MTTRGAASTLVQAVAVTTSGVLPAFLLGALAVQIRADLGLGPAQIGLAAATLFTTAGVLARPLGVYVQRIGAARGMVVAALLAALALTGVGLAPSYPVLILALVVGGIANSMSQPAANLSISRAIGQGRLGLAFGIKQSSIPAASILGGLAVPGIALVLGWRWAFLIGAAGAIAIALWAVFGRADARGGPPGETSAPDRGTPRGGLVVLTIGVGLASAAATSIGIFLVDSGVHAGLAPSTAGLLFAGAALVGLLIRIVLGAAMDRHPGRSPLVLVANLLALGSIGYLLLGIGSGASGGLGDPGAGLGGNTVLFALGALLAFCAGWTWPGLVHFSVVRHNRRNAASATGILQTGLSLGAAAGPLLFGLLVEATSYRSAWVAAAIVAVAAAVTVRIGRRMIRRSRSRLAPELPGSADPAGLGGEHTLETTPRNTTLPTSEERP